MAARVILRVTEGPLSGTETAFEHHDTFIFGRDAGCHARLPPDDKTASRHHFLLEVNPPAVRLRDLGSLNGTHVNGTKHGGRERGESPAAAQARSRCEVDLKHGDSIRVGKTVFTLRVNEDESDATVYPEADCARCARPIGPSDGTRTLCTACQEATIEEPVLDVPDRAAATGDEREAGAFTLGALLGKGGMGAVYLGRRTRDGGPVAVKVLIPRVAASESMRQKFLREIDSATRLKHDHVVQVLGRGCGESGVYLVMEYCPGGNLAELLARRGEKLVLAEAAPLMKQALAGLAAAHRVGLVHRDIKPANLLLTQPEGGQLKISDFGLAKEFDRAGLSGMTHTGSVGGTPYYMPREQLTNFKYVKPSADVWSVAATFYRMLSGATVLDFPAGKDALAVILDGLPVPLARRAPGLPAPLCAVIDRALAADLSVRFADAGEFAGALDEALR